MGNVKSFCCRDNVSEVDDREERSRILNDNCGASCEDLYDSTTSAPSHQDATSYGSINNGNKTMEQSALDRIYQKMASNIIDVAPGESMVIQQAEFIERQKAYQSKLNQIRTPLPLKLTSRGPKHDNSTLSATSSSNGHEKRCVEYEPISQDDIQLINEISTKSAQAIKRLKVTSGKWQVVTQFKP